MDFLSKLFNPKSIPFPRKKGNQVYSELLKFTDTPVCSKYTTKRIIQEVRLGNQTVVSKLDGNLEYLHISKNGRIKEFDLTGTEFEKSSNKLFERCDNSLSDLVKLDPPRNHFLKSNGVRLIYLTANGIYSVTGNDPIEMTKPEITGQTISHFMNLIDLMNPNSLKQIMKNSR